MYSGYNNIDYNNYLFIMMQYYGIDYFVKGIMITFLFQLLLYFRKILLVLLYNYYNKESFRDDSNYLKSISL